MKDCGFKAYVAGGGIRDLLVNAKPKDFDIVTDATPNQVKRIFRNCRIVGRRFRLAHVFFGDRIVEVATFRADSSAMESRADTDEHGEGRQHNETNGDRQAHQVHPAHAQTIRRADGLILRDNVYGTPRQDALRRDFTINALFYNIDGFTLIDYVGGMRDIRNRTVRTIGDPALRYAEDPVRMIRAIRFAAKLNFKIEQDSYDAIRECSGMIVKASNARMYEELLKLFTCGGVAVALVMLRDTGLWKALFPEVGAWADGRAEPAAWSRIEAGCAGVDRLLAAGRAPEPALVLALLFGGYLEHKANVLVSEGLWPAEAVMGAISQFIGEMAPRAVIPKRVGYDMAHILVAQSRLAKPGGGRAERFVSRHFFRNSLEYFRFRTAFAGGDMQAVEWWERTSAGKQSEPPPQFPPHRRRGNRRRRGRRRHGNIADVKDAQG